VLFPSQLKKLLVKIDRAEQITQIVTVDCKKEFLGVPQFAISYVTANGTEVALHQNMPITIFSFTSPYPVTPIDFLAAWKLINGSLLSLLPVQVLTESRRTRGKAYFLED
jgi:hypothetical protein